MIDPQRIHDKTDGLAKLMQERLGMGGKSFAVKLRRAGRLLPRFARRAGQEVAQAERMMHHPRLAALVDVDRFDRKVAILEDHLKGIDPKERRKTKALHMLASVVVNLALLGAAIYALVWILGRS
jgi:hypothetical protein